MSDERRPHGLILKGYWLQVTTSVEDLMSGSKWCDHYGTMVITNDHTKNHAVITFVESSVFKKEKRRDIMGQVTQPGPPTLFVSFSVRVGVTLHTLIVFVCGRCSARRPERRRTGRS